MSKVKSKDTNLELFVRKKLFAAGFRYKLNYKIDGKPDIVFIRKKLQYLSTVAFGTNIIAIKPSDLKQTKTFGTKN